MSSTYLSLHFHIVYRTKGRKRFIRADWMSPLHEYLGGTVRGLGGVAEAVGGVEDHVHLLVGLEATHCLADFMRELKKASSTWAAEKHEPLFGWQDGYAAFSVSATHCTAVRRYIANQKNHHKKCSFLEELKRLLKKNGVEYDPKYLI